MTDQRKRITAAEAAERLLALAKTETDHAINLGNDSSLSRHSRTRSVVYEVGAIIAALIAEDKAPLETRVTAAEELRDLTMKDRDEFRERALAAEQRNTALEAENQTLREERLKAQIAARRIVEQWPHVIMEKAALIEAMRAAEHG